MIVESKCWLIQWCGVQLCKLLKLGEVRGVYSGGEAWTCPVKEDRSGIVWQNLIWIRIRCWRFSSNYFVLKFFLKLILWYDVLQPQIKQNAKWFSALKDYILFWLLCGVKMFGWYVIVYLLFMIKLQFSLTHYCWGVLIKQIGFEFFTPILDCCCENFNHSDIVFWEYLQNNLK